MKKKLKARLYALKQMTKEELMIRYYAEQERKAYGRNIVEDKHIFATCKGTRTRKRVKNTFSREEMGTCGSSTRTIRTGAYSTIVCKSRAIY